VCNQIFANNLDNRLSRDTYEGLTRYHQGKFSTEKHKQKNIRITLPPDFSIPEFRGARVFINPTTNLIELPPPTQIIFSENNKKDAVLISEIDTFPWKKKGYMKPKLSLMANSDEEITLLIEKLRLCGLKYNIHTNHPIDITQMKEKQIEAEIAGTIDRIHRRALVKILINFSTFYFGIEETSKKEWEKAIKFTRFDEGEIPLRVTNEPFWAEETEKLRLGNNAIDIRIAVDPLNLIGSIRFYGQLKYDLKIIENTTFPYQKSISARFIRGMNPLIIYPTFPK
jgi:hypothetical protein